MSRRGALAAGVVFVVTAGAALRSSAPFLRDCPFLAGRLAAPVLGASPAPGRFWERWGRSSSRRDWIGFWPVFVLAAG